MSGLLLMVFGIWGGLSPFIGPYFGYAFGSHATWNYTADRLWLSILPAAAVVLGGALLLWAGHRVSGTLAAWIAMAGGAWFAVGPAFSRLWDHAAGPIGGPLFGATRQMLELIGSFYGVGVVIVGLAAFALGRFVSRPALMLAHPETAAEAAPDQPVTPAAGARSTETYEPQRSDDHVTSGVH